MLLLRFQPQVAPALYLDILQKSYNPCHILSKMVFIKTSLKIILMNNLIQQKITDIIKNEVIPMWK